MTVHELVMIRLINQFEEDKIYKKEKKNRAERTKYFSQS